MLNSSPPRTVVVIHRTGIGDLIWHIPYVRAIGAASADGKVSLIVRPSSRAVDVLAAESCIAEIIESDRRPRKSEKRRGRHDTLAAQLDFVGAVRRFGFERIYILSGRVRYAALALLARIPQRAGFGFSMAERLLLNRPPYIRPHRGGKALKNCVFKSGLTFHSGEAVITSLGIEGSGVYPLGYEIRKQLSEKNKAELLIDLKPQNTLEEIRLKLANRKNVSLTRYLEKDMNLGETKTLLLKVLLSKENFTDNKMLAAKIKTLPIEVTGLAPSDEAISTVGGVSLKEIDDHYQLKKIPNHFVIGELLDWDAPTGGYLLQACFSMGNNLAHYLNKN